MTKDDVICSIMEALLQLQKDKIREIENNARYAFKRQPSDPFPQEAMKFFIESGGKNIIPGCLPGLDTRYEIEAVGPWRDRWQNRQV